MDPPRDIQNFRRNSSTRSTVSSCSSLAMEIKRKKIRESMFFANEVSQHHKPTALKRDTLTIAGLFFDVFIDNVVVTEMLNQPTRFIFL